MIEFVLYGRDHPLGNISLSHKSFPAILVSARGWVSRETTIFFFLRNRKRVWRGVQPAFNDISQEESRLLGFKIKLRFGSHEMEGSKNEKPSMVYGDWPIDQTIDSSEPVGVFFVLMDQRMWVPRCLHSWRPSKITLIRELLLEESIAYWMFFLQIWNLALNSLLRVVSISLTKK